MYSKLSIFLICASLAACNSASVSDTRTPLAKPSIFQKNLTAAIQKIERGREQAGAILAAKPTSKEQRERLYSVLNQANRQASDALGLPWKEIGGTWVDGFLRDKSLPQNWREAYPDLAKLSDCEQAVQMAGLEVENQNSWLFSAEEEHLPLLRSSYESLGETIKWFNKTLVVCEGLSGSVELRELKRQQKSQPNK